MRITLGENNAQKLFRWYKNIKRIKILFLCQEIRSTLVQTNRSASIVTGNGVGNGLELNLIHNESRELTIVLVLEQTSYQCHNNLNCRIRTTMRLAANAVKALLAAAAHDMKMDGLEGLRLEDMRK